MGLRNKRRDEDRAPPSRTDAELSHLRTIRWSRYLIQFGGIVAAGALFTGVAHYVPLAPRAPAAPSPSVELPVRPPGTPASEWIQKYAEETNEIKRHRLVLEEVARGNMPSTWNEWVTITVEGRKGSVVEFEVSPHGLRIGTDEDWIEVPMDGPHFAAAADILDVRLATAWMIEKTHLQAKKSGHLVHYYAAAEIAHSLGYTDWKQNEPDGEKMKSPEFFQQRSKLLQTWLAQHDIANDELISGYFKAVVPPIDGLTRRNGLEMVGGRDSEGHRVQPLSGGFHGARFFDYSHNIRFARDKVRVNGQEMPMDELWGSVDFAVEFIFRRSSIPNPAYRYPRELKQWMREHGFSV